MENNFENFIQYRAELRYKHFNNNIYSTATKFNRETCAVDFWDINFFKGFFNMPCTTQHMRSLEFEKFLNNEQTHPTFDWVNIFNYFKALQKHPYFQEYLRPHITNSQPDKRDPLFWSILSNHRYALTGKIQNNQQLWI